MEPWREEHKQLVVIFRFLTLFHDLVREIFILFHSSLISAKSHKVSKYVSHTSDMMTFCQSPAGKTALKLSSSSAGATLSLTHLRRLNCSKPWLVPLLLVIPTYIVHGIMCGKSFHMMYNYTEKIFTEGVIHFWMHLLLFMSSHFIGQQVMLIHFIWQQNTNKTLGNKLPWLISFSNNT